MEGITSRAKCNKLATGNTSEFKVTLDKRLIIDKVFLFVDGCDCKSVNLMRYVKLNSYDVRTGKIGIKRS